MSLPGMKHVRHSSLVNGVQILFCLTWALLMHLLNPLRICEYVNAFFFF